MISEIQDVIQKNLPSQVAGELRDVLEHYEQLKRDNDIQKETIKELHEEVEKCRPWYEIQAKLKDDTKLLELEKQKFEIEKLELKLEVHQEKYNDVRSLMHDVFRNQRIVYNKQGQMQDCHYDGKNFYSGPVPVQETTEKVEE